MKQDKDYALNNMSDWKSYMTWKCLLSGDTSLI